MTTTVIATNTITSGVAHTFAAAGDELIILPNVTLGSTTASALGGTGLNNLSVTVLGNLFSKNMVSLSGSGVSFHIGQYGSVVSSEQSTANAAIFLSNARSSVVNDGQIYASKTIGVLFSAQGDLNNTGKIHAESAAFVYFASGVNILNSGLIASSRVKPVSPDPRYRNGI